MVLARDVRTDFYLQGLLRTKTKPLFSYSSLFSRFGPPANRHGLTLCVEEGQSQEKNSRQFDT